MLKQHFDVTFKSFYVAFSFVNAHANGIQYVLPIDCVFFGYTEHIFNLQEIKRLKENGKYKMVSNAFKMTYGLQNDT